MLLRKDKDRKSVNLANWGWGCSSVVEDLSSMCKALDFILAPQKIKINKFELSEKVTFSCLS